jgi:hypothetical protein
MRVILEPTEHLETQHKVMVELPGDDLDFQDAVDLIRYALLAWGYDSIVVDKWFDGGE